MLSGVGPARHLAELGIPVVRDLPGVGQNLKDHPKLYITWRVKEGHPVEEVPARGGANLRFTAPGSHLRNDLSINMGAFVTRRVRASELPFPADISDDLSDRRVEMMTGLLLPVSSGELRLTSTDADGANRSWTTTTWTTRLTGSVCAPPSGCACSWRKATS